MHTKPLRNTYKNPPPTLALAHLRTTVFIGQEFAQYWEKGGHMRVNFNRKHVVADPACSTVFGAGETQTVSR